MIEVSCHHLARHFIIRELSHLSLERLSKCTMFDFILIGIIRVVFPHIDGTGFKARNFTCSSFLGQAVGHFLSDFSEFLQRG